MDYNKILSLVYETRKIIFSKQLNPKEKNNNPYDFVTSVDLDISNFLKEKLYSEFSEVTFMTEEESNHKIGSKTFILDPIDGTTNLIFDYKMSSVSLAYAENNNVMFGVVFNPFTDEMFFSVKGKGAHLYKTNNGIEALLKIGVENYSADIIKVSNRDMKHSIIEFGACSSRKDLAEESFHRALRIFKECLDVRRICSTAIVLCYIASGRLDGYFEKIIKPWDFAAASLILEEAGGQTADWAGNPLPLDRTTTIVCANPIIFERLRVLVKGEA